MDDRHEPVPVCPSCGGPVSGRFCPTCGYDQSAPQSNPWAEPDEAAPITAEFAPVPAPVEVPSRRRPSVAALVVGVVALALVAVLALSWAGNGQLLAGPAPATTTSSTTTSVATSATATQTPIQTKEPVAQASTPAGLAPGLLCSDLGERGLGYDQAVAYWIGEGKPNRMDADRNGIPCETRYPREDVVAYWGAQEWGGARNYLGDLPSGLYCRDLSSRGLSYGQAVAYWLSQDMPSRMDDDADGIPCETVYGDDVAAAYWSELG